MSAKFNLVYNARPILALAPAADAGGRTGLWATCKYSHKAYIVFNVTQGNAATITLSFQQATSAAGANAKALSGNLNIWADQAVSQAAAGDTYTQSASATSFTTSATLANKSVIFELVPEEVFDITNGFSYFAISTGASNAANITQASYFMIPARFEQATALSALT